MRFPTSLLVAMTFLSSCGNDQPEPSEGPFGDLMEGYNSNEFSFLPKNWITTKQGKYQVGEEMLLGSGDGIAPSWKGKTVKVVRVQSLEERDRVAFEGMLEIADQDLELEFRQDQRWYLLEGKLPFTGIAFSYYPKTRAKKSRTVIVDGLPIGVIDEWNPDGRRKGGGFADDFKRDD